MGTKDKNTQNTNADNYGSGILDTQHNPSGNNGNDLPNTQDYDDDYNCGTIENEAHNTIFCVDNMLF